MGDKKEKVAKPTNCAECNKSLSKKTMYYRNGKYFCNKRCFKTAWDKILAEKKEAEEKAKEEAAAAKEAPAEEATEEATEEAPAAN